VERITEETIFEEQSSPFERPYKVPETKAEGLPRQKFARLCPKAADEIKAEEQFLQAFLNEPKKETAAERFARPTLGCNTVHFPKWQNYRGRQWHRSKEGPSLLSARLSRRGDCFEIYQ
jgi:hypothetical protein